MSLWSGNNLHVNHELWDAAEEGRASARAASAGKKEYSAMQQSVRDLVLALPNAKGGLINLGKKFSSK